MVACNIQDRRSQRVSATPWKMMKTKVDVDDESRLCKTQSH
jgi:hypothetical protein